MLDVVETKPTEDLLTKLGLVGMALNTPDDVILENVSSAIRRQLPQAWPHQPNDHTVAIVGGGWSIMPTLDELRDVAWHGAKIVALNGAARWLTERNFRPSAQVILDARASNARFITLVPDCKYFIASQCAPEIFRAAEMAGETFIWHALSTGSDEEKELLDRFYLKNWIAIPGTCCVAFRAIMLMRTLGFRRFHVFGVDSCYNDDGEHHAYEQPENDHERTAQVSAGGRAFRVSGWQLAQAVQFMNLAREMGERKFDIQLEFHGDGLITHLVKTGAELKGA